MTEALEQVQRWLLRESRLRGDHLALVEETCLRLREAGVPVARASAVIFALHPLVHARTFAWRLGRGSRNIAHAHGLQDEPGYAQSPVRALHQGREAELRRRLDGRGSFDEFPPLRELAADGLTEYLALAMAFGDGTRHVMSFATDAPGASPSRRSRRCASCCRRSRPSSSCICCGAGAECCSRPTSGAMQAPRCWVGAFDVATAASCARWCA